MDLNRFLIPLRPVALWVQFVCRSKTKLRNTIVWDRGERTYQVFLRSLHPLIILKILNKNLWFFIYIWQRIILNFYYFIPRWATFSLIKIWQWKICDEHYMYYNRRITTCVEHLSSFKLKYLRILEVLSISKFSN
jgi:hypothetical protein